MLSTVYNIAKSANAGVGLLKYAGISLGIKSIKYFIDSNFRDHAQPVPGSVLYCDLWVAVEHSGIYVGDGKISNIVVDGLPTASVELCGPQSFTSKSTLGRKIYVSCGKSMAVGHPRVARAANSHVGERSVYGLVIKNCHEFSTQCVEYADNSPNDASWTELLAQELWQKIPDGTWESSLRELKEAARKKLGTTAWRLWDWDGSLATNPPPEPAWETLADQLANMPLNPESMEKVHEGLADIKAYMAEVADETIPGDVRQRLGEHMQLLDDVSIIYAKSQDFLAQCPGAHFSYTDLKSIPEDFKALAQALQGNAAIRELARKMGRSYISEQRKRQTRIPQTSHSEVHGTHRSDDVMHLLPCELLNLEDETLENLFYARLLEKQLQTYELQGTTMVQGEMTEAQRRRTGPVVVCLDTSGSMQGEPLLKAKALLLALASILQKEQRSLHVLLFGSAGEIREFALENAQNSVGLLLFLQQGFGGGTDFEAPLERALELIAEQSTYEKADVLMISDGDCQLSPEFVETLQAHKVKLDCMVYSVLCNGHRASDVFSDEVMVL